MQPVPRTAQRIAVIGAGAAGLCAAKHLLARGVEVVVYELGSFIGGLWVYQNDNGLSPAYRSLHLNSEASITAYKDFPFPKDGPLYPDHFEVSRYLQAYAEHFGVLPHIRFRSNVVGVAETNAAGIKDGSWTVRLADGSVEEFSAVVVASGHQGVPKHADWRADFTGEYLHSNSYQIPEPFRNKRVLVVGMGNSAVDIASDICVVTSSTTISARSPVLVMPRMLFGVPTSRVLGKIEKRWMPWAFRRTMRELLTRIVHGSMEQWGFVTPKTRTHPTSHPSLMAHFVWNRITAKPGIASVRGNEVSFVDGSVASFDTIIAATGYAVGLPFLTENAASTQEHKPELFLRVVSPSQPGLYFVGLFNVAGGGNIRMMDDQAEWLADLVCGDVDLPDQAGMRVAIAEERAFLKRHYPASPRYALELDPTFYRKQLMQERKRALAYRQRVPVVKLDVKLSAKPDVAAANITVK
ncbi:flavin-containing monooxygenase [Glaciimonas immobilis]|uniref:Cation diffusion facilitator CzcD-associated flavoprotein CzcO n=1 Tax=Glaciimonas immobilis TaxID=728004 RepID=A0A840RXI9_9BURK|nr:NAD(P)-binding domain-containing protein [Glaciimonas immobilis]KAF3996479.1 NAD(P)-binding domain-containing protein [Glaciimonas immobilis]MBB5201170.1 cation diffusion facilitator CzcD-associated flavoprotein CzcO [Glaciimonas immobilis]